MKKRIFFLGLLSILMGHYSAVHAETAAPYLQNFNRSLNTNDHAFAPTGWSHLVDAFHYENVDYYVNYYYSTYSGLNSTGCLQINSQTVGDYWGNQKEVNDMLVTPAISGHASVYVKEVYSYYETVTGSIDFYLLIKRSNGSFLVGQKLDVQVPTLSNSQYVKVELPELPDNSYVGIRGNYVCIDDFEAEKAEVTLKRSLTISSATYTGPSFIDADADGNFSVSFKVRVTNNGDIPLDTDLEGYSISLVNASHGNQVLATVPINSALDIDQVSDYINISADLNIAQVPDTCEYDIVENLSNNRYAGPWLFAFPHKPIAKLTMSDDTKAMDKDTTMTFGISQGEVVRTMLIRSMGGAPLSITDITTTEGFGIDVQAPLTIDPHKQQKLNVKMTTDVAGKKSGMLTIITDAGAIQLPLEGETIPADEWFADFEDGNMPIGVSAASYWTVTYYPKNIKMQCNTRSAECASVFPSRMITPLLHVNEGEWMSLDVAKIGDDSFLNLYYSTDRINWTPWCTLSAEAEDKDFLLTDEVAYQAWDGDKYAFHRFDLAGIPAGDYYIAFEGGHCYVDNIRAFHKVSLAHDATFAETNCPVKGRVNTTYAASVKVKNLNDKVEQADGYTISLYFDNEKVAEAESKDIEVGGSAELSFSCKPTLAGVFNVYAILAADGYSISSDTISVTIKPEDAEADILVGTQTTLNRNAPVDLFNFKSQTETIYPAEILGFEKGSRILSLSYRGFSEKEITTHITVWMENTDDSNFASPFEIHDVETMTKVYDQDYTVKKEGKQSFTVELLTLSLENSFEYTGGNLRVVVQAVASSDQYTTAFFDVDGGQTDRTIGRATDYTLANATVTSRNMPVATFTIEPASTNSISTTPNLQTAPQCINLQGVKVSNDQRGLTIERYTNEKGEIVVRKVIK